MDFENEKKTQGFDEQPKDESTSSQENATPRHPRPRVRTTHAYSSSTGRGYGSQQQSDEGGFLPEGFGAGLQQGAQQRPYRPRYQSNNQEGGYQPRQGGYQSRQQGGYQPRQQGYRPRFQQGEGQEGGYQPRQQGYQSRPQQGGYQSRQQGYQSRPQQGGYQPRQQGGYQSRPQQGGYQPRQQGGYQSRPQQGGYQPRQQGGYQGRPQQGGYQPRQQGGYQGRPQRPGFRPQRQGAYDPNAKYSLKKRIEYSEEHIDPTQPLRLNKFLANAGVCSRREADTFIQAGEVKVNGEVVTELGTKVLRTDEITFRDSPVKLEKKVYVLLNKPKDYVTTSDDPQQRKTVMDLIKGCCEERIYPVGRLDRNTTGVLLFTNDGDLASQLTHPKFLKKKIYHATLDKELTAHDKEQIAEGITLDDGDIKADAIEYIDDMKKNEVGIEIHSGKNRIVRRIFEHLGYRVVKLDRVQFAGLTKKNVRRGDWRYLTQKEVEMLKMGAFE